MFGPDYTAGCPACSAIADGFNGFAVHLAKPRRDCSGRCRWAPLPKLQAYKRRMGMDVSVGVLVRQRLQLRTSASGFTEEQQFEKGIDYNYEHEKPLPRRAAKPAGAIPLAHATRWPDLFAFHDRDRHRLVHAREARCQRLSRSTTASCTTPIPLFARGVDALWGMYQWLDRAPWDATRRISGFAVTTSNEKR
jgi:predicted dithiol-disulfide oxidoreductase (DUF899 family)